MSRPLLKSILPRSLYWRAGLILFVPVVTVLLVLAVAFIQRHYEGVTRQMTANFAVTVAYLRSQSDTAPDPATAAARVAALGAAFGIEATLLPALPAPLALRTPDIYDLNGRLVLELLPQQIPGVLATGLVGSDVGLWLDSEQGVLQLRFRPSQVSARNPHQLLVVVLAAGIVMTLISFIFLKNQMRPIRRLAAAAEAFGRGVSLPYRPSGATEVRAAGRAFMEMRRRIEHHIEQRTLMLSGVSHDLRTPLTRIKLGLAMLDHEPEAQALLDDVRQMEALIDRFLEFARAEVAEEAVPTDLNDLVARAVAGARRAGHDVTLREGAGPVRVALRPELFARALDNLIDNAARYGKRADVRIEPQAGAVAVIVEDAGPGIPADRRLEALKPFVRLDAARGTGTGSGAGLGLAIAADAMRSHGGALELGRGTTPGLGGLEARLVLPRDENG